LHSEQLSTLASFTKITEVAQFLGEFFPLKKWCFYFGKKNGWTFWTIFSQTNLVTLQTRETKPERKQLLFPIKLVVKSFRSIVGENSLAPV
jgi:hypothetical protein